MILAATILALGMTTPDLVDDISGARMKATIDKLTSFHTRNTNSDGLTEACEWAASELRKIPRMQVEIMTYRATGRRMAVEKDVVQVVAVLPGRSDRRILVGGHIDSLDLRVDATTGRAQGADDDASGTALAMELARVFAQQEWENTLVFVCFSGEEQGLLGSTALAQRAVDEEWDLEAVFNNDIVGSSSNIDGYSNKKEVRVFSALSDDHQSRELARFTEWTVRHALDDFGVKLVFRLDRFGRGGDHRSFNQQGFNGIRFSEVHEEFSRQHSSEDKPEFIDPQYLRNVARSNFVAMAAMADAKPAPTRVRVNRRQGHDTNLSWQSQEGVNYVVYWRDSASPVWEGSFSAGAVSEYKVMGINKDDHTFAVGAVGGLPVAAR